MRKEKPETLNKASPDLSELEITRQEANALLETQYPEALKDVLLMLINKMATLEIREQDSKESAIVSSITNGEPIYMTREPSEITLLKNPTAGVQFLDNIILQESTED